MDGAIERLLEHFAVEKQQRTQRLVLRRCGDLLLHREIGQEGFDCGKAHLTRIATRAARRPAQGSDLILAVTFTFSNDDFAARVAALHRTESRAVQTL